MTKTNFKTMAKLLAVVAVVAALGGACTKEMAPDPTTVRLIRNINATATMPQQSVDKAYLHTSDRKVFWQPNDTISINGTAIRTHSIDPNDSTQAEFSGTIGAYTHTVEAVDYDCYWAVYPTSIHSSSSESGLVVNLPNTQNYNSLKPLSGTTYMAAHTDATSGSNNVNFAMKNLVTVLKLTLTSTNGSNDSLSKIVVSHSTQNLCGTFTTTTPTTDISNTSGGKSFTVNCTDGTHNYIDISSAKDVYIALPPLGNSGNLTIKLYNTNKKYTIKTLNMTSQILARNTIYTSTINNVAFEGSDWEYSMGTDKKVAFAPGNLRYVAANGTWQFAREQYLAIGDAAGNNTAEANRATQADTIDLFGWGTSGWNNGNYFYQPYCSSNSTNTPYTSTKGYGYGPYDGSSYNSLTGTYANADWGVYNDIYNPKTASTDYAGTWRTPTQEEWDYVLNTRKQNTSPKANARYTMATVNTDGTPVNGIIIFPDNYSGGTPSGVTWGTINDKSVWSTKCTSAGWIALENAGCVFLPVTGIRNGTSVTDPDTYGEYWSSTHNDRRYGLNVEFRPDYASVFYFHTDNNARRYYGLAVRLIKEL